MALGGGGSHIRELRPLGAKLRPVPSGSKGDMSPCASGFPRLSIETILVGASKIATEVRLQTRLPTSVAIHRSHEAKLKCITLTTRRGRTLRTAQITMTTYLRLPRERFIDQNEMTADLGAQHGSRI
jgi:hypothetical protein